MAKKDLDEVRGKSLKLPSTFNLYQKDRPLQQVSPEFDILTLGKGLVNTVYKGVKAITKQGAKKYIQHTVTKEKAKTGSKNLAKMAVGATIGEKAGELTGEHVGNAVDYIFDIKDNTTAKLLSTLGGGVGGAYGTVIASPYSMKKNFVNNLNSKRIGFGDIAFRPTVVAKEVAKGNIGITKHGKIKANRKFLTKVNNARDKAIDLNTPYVRRIETERTNEAIKQLQAEYPSKQYDDDVISYVVDKGVDKFRNTKIPIKIAKRTEHQRMDKVGTEAYYSREANSITIPRTVEHNSIVPISNKKLNRLIGHEYRHGVQNSHPIGGKPYTVWSDDVSYYATNEEHPYNKFFNYLKFNSSRRSPWYHSFGEFDAEVYALKQILGNKRINHRNKEAVDYLSKRFGLSERKTKAYLADYNAHGFQ